jgi:hypothetical protein
VAGGAESGGDWREEQFHDGGTYTPEGTGICSTTHIGRKLRTFEPMTGANVVVAGTEEAGTALAAALGERGVDARFLATDGLAGALAALEADLEERKPDAAVAAGSGGGALALAITAAKLGVPLAVVADVTEGDRADEGRILATLSSLEAGGDPAQAAERIAAWLE